MRTPLFRDTPSGLTTHTGADRVNRVKNPAFDQHSQHILNLKDPEARWFSGSVKALFPSVLAAVENLTARYGPSELVIIPSSKAGRVSKALDLMAKNACRRHGACSYTEGALTRTKTIEKLATGGDRSIQRHLESMSFSDSRRAPPVKILFDDISTSGNSIAAAATMIRAGSEGSVVVALVLGRTTHD